MMTEIDNHQEELHQQLEAHAIARAELEHELHLMQQFIRKAGHDLKTPITTLKTSLYLIQRKPELATSERLAMMEGQLERMSNMLEAMALMARLDGQTALDFNESDIMAIVNESFWVVQDAADRKNIKLHVEAEHALPALALNFEEFRRALVNLLDNAIRYSPIDGDIHIHLHEMHGYVCLDVVDSGVGMSDSEIQNVFERFYRGEDAGALGEMGAGMGLPIAKRIVELHGGKMRVMTEQGVGSTFRIMLPVE